MIEKSQLPFIDNARPEIRGDVLAISGISAFNFGKIAGLANYRADYVAIIGGNNISVNQEKEALTEDLRRAGNFILKNTNNKTSQYFLMLGENNYAVDNPNHLFDKTHEDDDMGSFQLFAKNTLSNKNLTQLAVDPPSSGWANVERTNKYWMHNTIQIDDGRPQSDRKYENAWASKMTTKILPNGAISSFDLSFDYINDSWFHASHIYNGIRRNVSSINTDDNTYYFLSDFINVSASANDIQGVIFHLNGNGNVQSGTCFKQGNVYRWISPCDTSIHNEDSLGLTYHFAALQNEISGKAVT